MFVVIASHGLTCVTFGSVYDSCTHNGVESSRDIIQVLWSR